MKKIVIIDYSIGNQTALINFFNALKYEAVLTNNFFKIAKADIIILPGVGAYQYAMNSLKKNNLIKLIKNKSKNTKIIGICLGMQLLASNSEEFGQCDGLNLIPGNIKRIKKNFCHVGWNNITISSNNVLFYNNSKENYYFNHSFFFKGDKKYIKSFTKFKKKVPAIIQNNNCIGLQFHPEKSLISGKKFMLHLLGQF